MKAFLALLGISFKSLLLNTSGLGGGRKSRKKAASGLGALILISGLMVYISGIYSFMMAAALAPVGGMDIMLFSMLVLALTFPLMFTMFSSQSLIFSVKDIDLVLSLPVSAFSVMLARVLALYLEVLLMVEMLLLPAGVAWHVNGGGGLVLPMMALLGIFLAFIPTLLALIFGSLISIFIARLRFKNLFTVLFSLLLVGGIMVASLTFSGSIENIATDIEGIRALLQSSFTPLMCVVRAITGPDFLAALLTVLVCVLPFLGITWLFSKLYKSLLTSLSTHAMRRNFKLGAVAASGQLPSLLKKEARKFFGTPGYVLNSGIGVIMAMGAAVFALVKRDTIRQALFSIFEMDGSNTGLYTLIPILLLAVLAFMLMTINPAGVSISLEGKTLWILKEAPIGLGRIFAAKAGFTFLLAGGTVLLATPMAGIAFDLAPLYIVLMTLLGLFFALLGSMLGLFINLLLPRMDVENEMAVIKQSSSVIVSMLADLAVAALVAGLYILLSAAGVGFVGFALAALLLLAALNGGMLALLNTKGRALFAKL